MSLNHPSLIIALNRTVVMEVNKYIDALPNQGGPII